MAKTKRVQGRFAPAWMFPAASLLLLAACVGGESEHDALPPPTGDVEAFFADAGVPPEENLGILARLRELREAHLQDPTDIATALEYSQKLRQIGSAARALEVIEGIAALTPDDLSVRLELGKSLLANGEARRALEVLESLPAHLSRDWSLLSAYGIALDHAGRHQEAQEQYRRALELEENHPTILTNLGLSYALAGDPITAEKHLRRALADPRATAHTRQNLALVLGLRGRFEEAEQLATKDLTLEAWQGNREYLRELLGSNEVEAPTSEQETP